MANTPAGILEVIITANLEGLKKGLEAAHDLIEKYSSKIKVAAKYLAGAIVAGLTAAIYRAAEFESGLAKISILLDSKLSGRILPEFAAGLERMSLEFGHGASMADALYGILAGNIAPEKALSVLEVSAKAATAGFTDAKTAAEFLVSVLKSYKRGAEDAVVISDMLFAVMRKGGPSFAELSSSLQTILPYATQAGISFEELAGAIQTMEDQGIRFEQILMSLRSLFMNLNDVSPETKNLAMQMGFEFSTTALKAKGLAGFLEEARIAANNAGIDFGKVFSNRSLIAALALSGEHTATFRKNLDQLRGSAGATDEVFKKSASTLEHSFLLVKELVLALLTRIGTELLPIVKELFDYVLDRKDILLAFARDLGIGIRKWADDLSTVLTAVHRLFDGIIEKWNALPAAVRAAMQLAAKGLSFLGPVGAAADRALQVGGAVGSITDARTQPRWTSTLPTTGGIASIPSPAQNAQSEASEFERAWKEAYANVFQGAKQTTEQITEVLKGVISSLSEGFQNLFITIAERGNRFGDVLKGIFTSLRNLVFKVISDILARELTARAIALATDRAAAKAQVANAIAVGSAKAIAAHAWVPGVGLLLGLAAAAALVAAIANIAQLKEGGVVSKPTMAMIGEGGESEAVIPLSKLDSMLQGKGKGVSINITGTFLEGDESKWEDMVRRKILPSLVAYGLKTRSIERFS